MPLGGSRSLRVGLLAVQDNGQFVFHLRRPAGYNLQRLTAVWNRRDGRSRTWARSIKQHGSRPRPTHQQSCGGRSRPPASPYRSRPGSTPAQSRCPAGPTRTADLVATLDDPSGPPVLLVFEFQSQHDPDKLDVTLEEAGILRGHARHGDNRQGKYKVLTALVYLQGRCPDEVLNMTLSGGFGTRHAPLIWNVGEDDAAATLEAVGRRASVLRDAVLASADGRRQGRQRHRPVEGSRRSCGFGPPHTRELVRSRVGVRGTGGPAGGVEPWAWRSLK